MIFGLTFRLAGFNPKLVCDLADFFFRYDCYCRFLGGHGFSPAQAFIL